MFSQFFLPTAWFDFYFENFFSFFPRTDIIDLVFSGQIYRSEMSIISILSDYTMIELMILTIIPYYLLTININRQKKNYNLVILISIFSLIHYMPIFGIHFVQILAYVISFIIRTPINEKSPVYNY